MNDEQDRCDGAPGRCFFRLAHFIGGVAIVVTLIFILAACATTNKPTCPDVKMFALDVDGKRYYILDSNNFWRLDQYLTGLEQGTCRRGGGGERAPDHKELQRGEWNSMS
jgi:hypothetical protein